jgi:ABC-type Fe3+-hydroxamate transport system substrate-binding protein
MSELYDDQGTGIAFERSPRRVVSVVPSLTESVCATAAAELLVGATDWCTHPPDLELARIGGTKNPRVGQIIALRPDVVLANDEENRPADIAALREAGVQVWVTAPRSVPNAITSLTRMLNMLGVGRPSWLVEADRAWSAAWDGQTCSAVVPIWRRPWMALGRDTFAGDVLHRVGVSNVLAGSTERYPRFTLDDLPEYDVVVLPDEPYAFAADDGPEAFQAPARLISGRHLTWYGPSLAEARTVLAAQIWDSR